MVLLKTPITQLEKEKFREPSADNIAVAVVNPDGSYLNQTVLVSLASLTVDVGINKDSDSVTAWQGGSWVEGTPYSSPSIFTGMVSSASGGLVQFPPLAVMYATVRASNSNATTIYVGGSLATINNAYPLDPGETIGYSLTNLNELFLVGVGTSEVRYTGGI